MSNKRLVKSLFLSYLWITLAAVVLVGLYGAHVARQRYLDRTAEDLRARARFSQGPLMELLERGDEQGVDATCKELGDATSTRITVILPSGRVVGDTREDPARMDNHKDRPEVREAASGTFGRSIRHSATVNEELMYVAIPVRRDGTLVAIVRTSIPVTAINRTVAAIRLRIVVAALGVTGLLAVVSLWLAARIGLPLQQMSVGAERFAQGQFDHPLPVVSFKEIRALAEAMNRMAQQLDERIRTIQCQQNELEAVLGSMEDGVLAIDDKGVVIKANQRCAALLGLEPVELRGSAVGEIIRQSDLLEFVESAFAKSSAVESDILVRDDEDRWLNVHGAALYDAVNERIGTLIVLHDVTRLRRLEDVRRDFVANVSHELRTPITSIKGFVETLIDGALDERENATRFLDIIARQVNRLDAIIKDLLTLSRLETGIEQRTSSRLERGAVRNVVLAAIEMCHQKADDKHVEIQWECSAELTAPMNAQLLEQAVINLIDNAVKYSEPGQRVCISAACVEQDVVLRIQDWGCGIESKHLPRLFERFYRVDKARSRELGGTGLGLAIVRHIVRVHRGSVDVESTVGAGSTFSIRLPASAATFPTYEAATPP